MTRIILNADDFGKSSTRNRAIDDSFKQGLICSAGLIVTGKHLQEAVDLMFKGDYVDHIHLHFNLSANLLQEDSEDAPLTDAIRLDPFFCKDGQFRPYKGLPRSFSSIRKWRSVYREMAAQFELFKSVTKERANYKHIDFHLWYNLTWPVSIALNVFSLRYHIRSVRVIGIHQKSILRYRVLSALSWNVRVKYIPATNIDYFLSKRSSFENTPVLELYCHPNYKEGVFLDDSPSYLGHDRQPMNDQITKLKSLGYSFISWEKV